MNFDESTIKLTLETLGAAIGLGKQLGSIGSGSKDPNIKKLASELADKLLTLQLEMMGLQQQILTLIQENSDLHQKLLQKDSVVFHDGAAWERSDAGTEEGPFCPGCWSGGARLYRSAISWVGGGSVTFNCDRHKNTYMFHVPERFVKNIDLDQYREVETSKPRERY